MKRTYNSDTCRGVQEEGDKAHVKITLNHGASQKELLTKLKVNKMFMSRTQSFI